MANKKKPALKGKTPTQASRKKKKNRPISAAARRKTKQAKTPKKVPPQRLAPKKLLTRRKTGHAPAGLPERLKNAALKVLGERQADQIVTADVRGRSAMTDYVIIASGRSARQLAAIADYLRTAFAALGARKIMIEGLPQGDWVLVDGGDVLVHLFRPEVRRYYSIEDLWNRRRGG